MFSIGQVHGTAVGTILFNTPWATLLLKVSPLKKDFFAGYAQHPPSVYKALLFSAEADMAGLIVGAKAPIALTSRGATEKEKRQSLLLAAACAKGAK